MSSMHCPHLHVQAASQFCKLLTPFSRMHTSTNPFSELTLVADRSKDRWTSAEQHVGMVQYATYMFLSITLTDSGGKHCLRSFDHWPSAASLKENSLMPNIIVQMERLRPRPAEDFLKFGPLYKYVFILRFCIKTSQSYFFYFRYSSRKFSLPNYDHSLKWKRAGKSGKNFNVSNGAHFLVILYHWQEHVFYWHSNDIPMHNRPGPPQRSLGAGQGWSIACGYFIRSLHVNRRCSCQTKEKNIGNSASKSVNCKISYSLSL